MRYLESQAHRLSHTKRSLLKQRLNAQRHRLLALFERRIGLHRSFKAMDNPWGVQQESDVIGPALRHRRRGRIDAGSGLAQTAIDHKHSPGVAPIVLKTAHRSGHALSVVI